MLLLQMVQGGLTVNTGMTGDVVPLLTVTMHLSAVANITFSNTYITSTYNDILFQVG